VATLGVVLPSFIIILIVSVIFDRFINSKYVQGFFEGVKPVVVGLVAGAALTIVVTAVIPQLDLKAIRAEDFNVDWIALVMTAAFLVLANIKFPMKIKVATGTDLKAQAKGRNASEGKGVDDGNKDTRDNVRCDMNAGVDDNSEDKKSTGEGQPQFKIVKKTIHPIALIGIAALLGILLFGVLGIGG